MRRLPGIEFVPHRLAYRFPMAAAHPQPGELFLWRFRPELRTIARSRDNGYTRLSEAELERMRNHPNPALGRRFAVSRAVLREILSDIVGCAPTEVELSDDAHGRPRLFKDGEPHALSIAVVYAGIWVMAAISAAPLGLASRVPALPEISTGEAAKDGMAASGPVESKSMEMRVDARRASLVDAAAGMPWPDACEDWLWHEGSDFIVDAPHTGHWHIVDLPMPGAICAAAAIAQPISRVRAFGWIGRDRWIIAR